ncbi:MAG TPA: nucleotidyltransferase domain-containing protein [bacterium]|nr:nucleotidyltransferase domain-containing protein [bacterium]HPP30254.1 nucleotidyltransferase domain-containing protein [bacterium]
MKDKKLTEKVILKTLKETKDELKRYGVKKIGLFGSFTKGEQRKNSDIDLLVEFDLKRFGENFKGLYKTYIELSEYLEKLFGRKVDILTPVSVETIRIQEIAEEIKKSVIYV